MKQQRMVYYKTTEGVVEMVCGFQYGVCWSNDGVCGVRERRWMNGEPVRVGDRLRKTEIVDKMEKNNNASNIT